MKNQLKYFQTKELKIKAQFNTSYCPLERLLINDQKAHFSMCCCC